MTVTEGIRPIGTHRNATIEHVSFVDEDFNTRRLWKNVEEFIEKKYDMDVLEKIVLHGDGRNWIRNGLNDFGNVVSRYGWVSFPEDPAVTGRQFSKAKNENGDHRRRAKK